MEKPFHAGNKSEPLEEAFSLLVLCHECNQGCYHCHSLFIDNNTVHAELGMINPTYRIKRNSTGKWEVWRKLFRKAIFPHVFCSG